MRNIRSFAEKPQSKSVRIAVIKRLAGYLLQHKLLAFLALAIMLTSNLLALAAPMFSGKAINAIKPGVGQVDMDTVLHYCILMAICYIVSGILSYTLAIIMMILSKKIVYTMRRQVFDHLTELPVGFFDTHATGDIISHISYDIDVVNASLSHDLLQILTSVVTVVGSLIMMATIAPVLIAVFAITVPASILFTKWRTKKMHPLYRARSSKLGELNGYAEEMLTGQHTIRT